MTQSQLIHSNHIDKFTKNAIEPIEIELELISKQLDIEENKNVLSVLWRRYDQLRFAIAVLDNKFKYDPDKQLFCEPTLIEIED